MLVLGRPVLTCVVTRFFIIFLRSDRVMRMLPGIFRTVSTSNKRQRQFMIILKIFSVDNFPTLPIYPQFGLVNQACGCSQRVLDQPQTEEGIGGVTVSQFMIFPIWLTVCPRLVYAMVHNRIYSAGTEGESSWRVSRDLTIRWNRTHIWCVPMHPYVFDYL